MNDDEHKYASMSKEDAEAEVHHLLQNLTLLVVDGEEEVAKICQICQQYPELAVQHYVVLHSILECLVRNRTIANGTIEGFCRQFPKSLSVQYALYGDMLPLHRVCANFRRRALIPTFVQGYPEAVRVMNGEGKYPIHIFFDMLCGPGQNFRDVAMAEGLHPLLNLYPESLVAKDVSGLIPLNYVMAFDLPPDVIQCLLSHAPRSGNNWAITTLFLHHGVHRSLSAQRAHLLARFLLHLKQLVFTPVDLRGRESYEPQGWIAFFQSFTRMSQLTNLEIEVPYHLFTIHHECYAAFAETLPQLTSIKSLILSFQVASPITRVQGNREQPPPLDLALPIAALIRRGNLGELIVRDGIKLDPQTILNAVADNPPSRLTTLDLRSVRPGCNVTDVLVRMIASNGPLEALAMKHITFEQVPVFDALARNTHLKSLRLPGLLSSKNSAEDADKDDSSTTTTTSLSRVLRHHNVTLEQIQCLGATYVNLRGQEYKSIQHYTLLNRLGRAKMRHATITSEAVVQLLDVVLRDMELKRRQATRTSVVFGLLREAPFHWCSS